MAWLKRSPYWFFEFYQPFTIAAEVLAHLHGVHLHLTRSLQLIHPKERGRGGFTAGQEAVMTQNHVVLVAQRFDQPLAFTEVDRDALEIVIRNLTVELC